MYSNHVRRNPGQASQQPFDHRMPTNPQPIPNSAPRNLAATGAARSFPSYSPAQSPQHAGQYFPSPSASTNPHELNRGHGAVVSGTAPLTVNKVNGTQPVQMYATPQRPAFQAQYQQQMPPQQYTTPVTKFTSQPQVHSGGHYPQQSHHPAPAGLIQQSGSPYHQMYIHPNMPSVRPRYSQNAHNPGIINPTQSPLQPTSPTYYHPSPSYFQNMQQVPGYYDPQHMTYQHPPPSQPIVIAPQPTPPTPNSATAPRRAASKVVIRDPNTGADITNDLLRKEGTPTGRSSATSTPPAASHGNEQIAAQFAAQVAAAATGSPGRSPVPSHVPISVAPVRTPVHFAPQPRSSQSVVGIPSGVDTSLPPPTMPPNMSIPPPDLNAMQTPSPKAYPVVTHAPAASPQDVPAKIPTAQVRPQVQKTTAPDVAPQITPIVSKRSEQPPIAVVQPQQQNNNSSPAQVIYQATEDEELKIEKTAPEAEPTELISNAGVELTLEKISDEKTADVEKATTEEESSKDQVDKEAAAAEPTDVDVVDVTVEPAEPESLITKTEPKIVEEIVKAPKIEPTPSITVTEASPVVQKMDGAKFTQPKEVEVESNMKNTVEPEAARVASSETKSETAEEIETVKEKEVEVQKVEESTPEPPVQTDPVKEEPESKPDSTTKVVKPDPPKKEDKSVTYGEDQWRPDNQEGKKVYDRKFLLQFQNLSLSKPLGLVNIEDIVLERPNPKMNISSQPPSYDGMYRGDRPMADFTPKYMNQGGHGRSTSRGMRGPQRPGGYQSHPGPMPAPKVIKKVSIQREVDPLVRSENAWKPSKLDVKPNDVTEEEVQTAEILRNVRSILNKLTPQKFNPLMKRLQSLEINTEQRLREVIDLIFEKAIDEPSFCEPYANMCRTMSQFRVNASSTPGTNAPKGTFEFRKILLTRCQREFEKDRTNEEVLEELKTKIENASTPEEKATLTDDLEMCISKQRRRMLGNIRLIGELFKLQMLTESIMHNCIMSLFRARDDDSLESLCRLLTTIGKDLDHTKGKTRMDQYFEQINKIVREQKTSSRVRFMLKDVIDLRLNNWVQRAIKEKGPKTIDQIHADAKEEKEQFALKAAAIASNPPMKNQSRSGRASSRGGAPAHQSDDGWTKVGVATQKPTRYDPNKMKLSKQAQFDEANVTLGPSRGKSGWKSGSGSAATKSGSYSSTRDTEPAPRSSTPTMINRFSALGNQPQESTSPFQQRRASGRQSSREGTKSGSRGSMGPPAAPYRGKDERQALLDAARKLTSQEEKKRGTSPSVKSSPRSESPITPAPQMDVAFLEKKSKSIIMEYLHLHDIKEAIECYAELKPPHNLFHIVVSSAMETSIEKSSTDREHVATLICELFKVGKLSEEQYLKGAATNIELAADLELDLPKVWSCMAELVAPVIHDPGCPINLPHLVTLSQPLVELDKSLVFVMEILKKLISIMPADAVAKQWEEHHLQWNNFAPTTDPARIAELLNRNNLTMFGGAPNGNHSAVDQTSNEDLATCVSNITRHLDKLQTDDMLFDWIEATFSAKERSEAKFIRALTTAICQRAIVETGGAMEVDKQVIISRSVGFKKFVDNEEKELEAVYALQKLYSDLEQPPNILKLLFDLIYDEEIISEQTFFKWEKTDNPAESEGRGVALMSVKPFFTWLREAEVESDE